ncbi:MAG TPA: hypothetical protein VNY27_02045, partial [Solirubrobacteraceae bacterium]|nr:hypothetical protein [Solirubrobacteraceae bacterium]
IDPVLGVRRRRGADRYREQIIHVPSVPHAQVKQTGFLQAVVVRLNREIASQPSSTHYRLKPLEAFTDHTLEAPPC